MSTKSTIAHGDYFHFYKEMYEEGSYLEFEKDSVKVTLYFNDTETYALAEGFARYLREGQ